VRDGTSAVGESRHRIPGASVGSTRDIPIIGMSAHALASERETAIATGRDEFDAKPIELE
jgi:CheY-like chemotaxis protein